MRENQEPRNPFPGIPPNFLPIRRDDDEGPGNKSRAVKLGDFNWVLIILCLAFIAVGVSLLWDFVSHIAGSLAEFTEEVSRTFKRTGFRNERELTNFFTITLFLAFLGLIYWLLRRNEGDDDEG